MLYFLLLSVKKSEGNFEKNTKHYPEGDIGIKLDLSQGIASTPANSI